MTLHEDIDSVRPVASFRVVAGGLLAIIAGTLLAAILLPAWLPGMAGSVSGEAPKAFWFLSRGTAMVSFGLLWASMALGLMITNRMARMWPGGPAAFDIHQYTSLLGLGFGVFHALILLGDKFINFNLAQILMPFAASGYRPTWVGLGQVGVYVWALVVASFYIRKQIGNKTWRLVHFGSFLSFALVMVHGVMSGSDSGSLWAGFLYWAAGGSLLVLLFYRILANQAPRKSQAKIAQGEVQRTSGNVR